ncbi:hypothetical protein [Atlantibacter hermannii]|uniref:hypothetical protein n=1 Tax=Atlantibacter hermannii TaxID=565 RepID=UPI00289C2574|nr:hypothetical protein [Atlantibacter hermannii]
MTDNNKHLVRVGHEFAAAMSDDTPIITIAKMVTELASALDVQSARSDALAAELARYSMPAGESDQRMAESRAVRQALGFGQDADDVAPVDLVERINALAAALKASEANDADARCHVAELEEKCAALAVDNSALNKFITDDCWIWDDKSEEYFDAADCMPETPSTDAFLAEVRAQGVDEAINCIKTMMVNTAPAHHAVGMLHALAAQLRGGQV